MNLAPVTVGRRRVDQLKVLGVIREILHNDDACTPYFEPYCIQLEKMLHALAFRANLYDIDSCVVLCDLVEEFLSSLILCSSSRTRHRVGIQNINVVDWGFWIQVVQHMLVSENSNTELRALAFLFNVWDHIPIASPTTKHKHTPFFCKDPLNRAPTAASSASKLQESMFDLYYNEQEGLRWNCAVWLLSPQMWKRYFCHWHPLVRAYYLRLVCWRVASVGPDSGFLTSVLFANYNADVRHLLDQRLEYTFQRFTEIAQVSIMLHKPMPSAAPCLPVLHRQLKIVYNPASSIKPLHPTQVPMIYNNNGNGSFELGKDNKILRRYGSQLSMSGQSNHMICTSKPRHVDPYEVFDDVAYSYSTVAQAPDLLSSMRTRNPGKPFAANGSTGTNMNSKSSSALNNMTNAARLTNRRGPADPAPLHRPKSASLLKPLNSTDVNEAPIVNPRVLTTPPAARPMSMPQMINSRPLSTASTTSRSSVVSAASTDGNNLEPSYNDTQTSPPHQTSLRHTSSFRKKWDFFKSGRKSGLRKYFGNAVTSDDNSLTANEVKTNADGNEPLSLQHTQTAALSTHNPGSAQQPGQERGLITKTSLEFGTSQFFDAVEPPASVIFTLNESSEDEDAGSSDTEPQVTGNNSNVGYSSSCAASTTSQASTTFSSLVETPASGSSSTTTLSSPNSFYNHKNLSTASVGTERSLRSPMSSTDKSSKRFSKGSFFRSNGSTEKPSSLLILNQPLPPLPSKSVKPDFQSQPFFSTRKEIPGATLSRKASLQSIASETDRRKGTRSSISSLDRTSGVQSSSSSSTNISAISEGPKNLENATTSLIPAPPQILRKRPEIVRPQYKFSLDQCEESIRRQQGFIQAKRVSMYHQYQNGNYGNPNGHFMPMSYNYSNSSSTSLVDNNSSDYYSYHTKGYFVYRQLNQGGIDIGSVVSDCYIAKPRLPFDGYSDQDIYSRRDGQVSFRNQGLQPFLKSGTSLNSISDEEYIALNIVGVRLRDLLQTNGAFHGALEMVQEISGKYIQPYTNSLVTGSEYSRHIVQLPGGLTLDNSKPLDLNEFSFREYDNKTQHQTFAQSKNNSHHNVSEYTHTTNQKFNQLKQPLIKKQQSNSSSDDLNDIWGNCISSPSSLSSYSTSSTSSSPVIVTSHTSKHNTFDINSASTKTTLIVPSDDKSDLSNLSTPTADSFTRSHSSLSAASSNETTVVSLPIISVPVVDEQPQYHHHHQLSTSSTASSEGRSTTKNFSVPTSFSGATLISSATCDTISSMYTARTGITPSPSIDALAAAHQPNLINQVAGVYSNEQQQQRQVGFWNQPQSLPNSNHSGLGLLDSDMTVLDPNITPTCSTTFMTNPFEMLKDSVDSSHASNPYNNTPSTPRCTNTQPSQAISHLGPTNMDIEDEDEDETVVSREFEYSHLKTSHERAMAKLRDNDKYWKYGGRSLNEWHLVVREFTDFVQMRKAAPYEVTKLEDLDIPFLIAEIPSKALVG